MIDISDMKSSVRWEFMRKNLCTCPKCNTEKKLTLFYDFKKENISGICRKCQKKMHGEKAMKIALDFIFKENLL